ncbi:hypothetical protein HMPREF1076_03421 [Parabacteroides goldsteinii CL02T12C30]|jgi:hypothetical protein|uniref:Uncharacterized protein n=1 Tax=Parabacteroides goldsteinii CL02T12C30 TaxID=999418 RepID=K5ZLB2_9BACT|nr:hypothetical protein HMPREF1076_03421 [Parabacteroides goldsteinii CL02T12C30]
MGGDIRFRMSPLFLSGVGNKVSCKGYFILYVLEHVLAK